MTVVGNPDQDRLTGPLECDLDPGGRMAYARCPRGWSAPGKGRRRTRPRSPSRRRRGPPHRTGTRADAYRPATSSTSRPTSTTPVTRAADRSSSVRARRSRSSTRAESRVTSGTRSSGSRPPSPSRVATSSCVRIEASGLRSSWAASATKARWVRRAAATRSSISFNVVARAAISSRVGGTGRRSSVDDPSIREALLRSCSTGVQCRSDDPPRDERADQQQQGEHDQEQTPQRAGRRLEVRRRQRGDDGQPVGARHRPRPR